MSEADVLQTIGALVLVTVVCYGALYIAVKVVKFAWTGDW